jgi:hypothetical protein
MEFTWSLVNLAAHLAQTVRHFLIPHICRGCRSSPRRLDYVSPRHMYMHRKCSPHP